MALSTISSIIQTTNDIQSSLTVVYLEITLVLILLSVTLFILIATPVVLLYFMVDSYFKWKENKSLITNNLCCTNNSHSTYVTQVCNQYQKYFTKLISNASGLFAWNLFSIIYISIEFTNFNTGVYNYLLFPFEVIESYQRNNSLNSISEFKTQGIYMVFIFVLSLLSFYLGKYIAQVLLKNSTAFSLKEKLFDINL